MICLHLRRSNKPVIYRFIIIKKNVELQFQILNLKKLSNMSRNKKSKSKTTFKLLTFGLILKH